MSKLRRRLADPLLALLQQGMKPDKLGLCLALGICLSCFPVPGVTTLLCVAAALALRLNLPAIQLANYAATPLQLLLLLPLIRMGEKLFKTEPLPVSVSQLLLLFRNQPWHALRSLWMWQWHAIVAWTVLVTPTCFLLTFLLRLALRYLPHLQKSARDQASGAEAP